DALQARLRPGAPGGAASPSALGPVLAHCAQRGLQACVQLLLRHGAPPDARALTARAVRLGEDAAGQTALHLAAANGHVAVCRSLLSSGASRESKEGALLAARGLGKFFAQEMAQLEDMLA
ncbi:unnamed protein product, partial [Polarella glacialis]